MTEQENVTSNIQAWWNETSFPAKEQYSLNEKGILSLLTGNDKKERTISTLTADNAEIVLKALQDKFPEVAAKVNEIQEEWNNTEDKLKLAGKVERTKEYLQHANAIGDFNGLLQQVNGLEQKIQELSEENYKAKLQLVEQGEALADGENYKETTQAYRDIAERWKQTGYADKHKSDALWNRLEAARNKFFDRKRQNQEAQEKDMLQNLDLKIELVDKAEALANSESWKQTTEAFRQLMEQWKATGRTLPEKNEALWVCFINAKNTFFDRKKANFENIQQEQEANYLLKQALLEKAEAMKESTNWTGTTQAYADLMEEWKKIGRVPQDKSDELWDKLNAAKEVFFNAKRTHFETFRISLEDNYAQKMGILKRAEALKNSTQWREATDELNELMDEWKKIGPVPREHSDNIWNQFLAARKQFFERKDANRDQRKKQAEKHKEVRVQQAQQFVHKLEAEIKEEEENLADFKNSLENITPGRKEQELRAHLENLIIQSEARIKHKQEKLASVKNETTAKEE